MNPNVSWGEVGTKRKTNRNAWLRLLNPDLLVVLIVVLFVVGHGDNYRELGWWSELASQVEVH